MTKTTELGLIYQEMLRWKVKKRMNKMGLHCSKQFILCNSSASKKKVMKVSTNKDNKKVHIFYFQINVVASSSVSLLCFSWTYRKNEIDAYLD